MIAAAGPFGTFERLTLIERLGLWSLCTLAALLVGVLAQEVINTVRPVLPGWQATLLVSLTLSLIFTPLLIAVTIEVAGHDGNRLSALFAIACAVFTVPVALTALTDFWFGTSTEAEDRDRPRLLNRIEEPATEVRRITVRDHYVDVFTDLGKSTLLMRFSDALDELEGVAGFRVHRSHWVSRSAIVRVEEDGARMFLRLDHGDLIPVSRGYRKVIEEADLPR